MSSRLLLGAVCALALSGCAPRAPAAAPPAAAPRLPALEFLGEQTIPPLTPSDKLKAARFGGISGLTIDPTNGELLGICDDEIDPRVFIFRPTVSGFDLTPARPGRKAFGVDLKAYFPLPPGPGAAALLDGEGIVTTRTGRVFVSSEGFGNREPRVPPGILEYNRRVDYLRQLEVPAKFLPPATGPLTRGVRHNTGFESLTITPDERRLFTATESALAQDGDPATLERGTTARILEYEAAGNTFDARREFAYPLDPVARPDFTPGFFINGLVELLALGDTELLSMERSYAEEPGGTGRRMYSVRIFRVSLDRASDISGLDSLRRRSGVRTVRKTLLLDLSQLKGLTLDNYEGMAFGPPLPDGGRSLILVSDDNFEQRQRTSFLLFRLRIE